MRDIECTVYERVVGSYRGVMSEVWTVITLRTSMACASGRSSTKCQVRFSFSIIRNVRQYMYTLPEDMLISRPTCDDEIYTYKYFVLRMSVVTAATNKRASRMRKVLLFGLVT